MQTAPAPATRGSASKPCPCDHPATTATAAPADSLAPLLDISHQSLQTQFAPLSADNAGSSRFALLLGSLVFLMFPAVLLGLRTFVFRDFSLFSYPVAFFARESFHHGELPLWNPFNHCGIPFLAQWNTMVLYPPTLLYLCFPMGWGLPFFCLLHLFWGGLGMYFLAQHWTRCRPAACLAGVIFAFNGLTLNFLIWPSHIATFSWLPWVLWLAPEAWRRGGRWLVWAIGTASLQMLAGGPETIVVTWLLLGLLATADICSKYLSTINYQLSTIHHPLSTIHYPLSTLRRQILFRFGAMVLLVGLICAAQLLPFLELLKNSQRDTAYAASTHDWSMPIWGWANFLVPLFRTNPTSQGVFLQNGQYWTSSYYVGIGTIWLATIALWRRRDWRVRLLGLVCFLALVLSWGDTSLLFSVLRACFPGLGFMRYPVKFVIFAVALFPLLAAFGLTALISERPHFGRFEWGSAIALLALVGLIVAIDRHAPPDVWRFTWHNALGRAAFLIVEVFVVWCFVQRSNRIRFENHQWTPMDTNSCSLVSIRGFKSPGSIRGFRWPAFRFWLGQVRISDFLPLLLLVFYLDLLTHVPNQNPTVAPQLFAPGLAQNQFPPTTAPTLGQSRAMVSPAAREKLRDSWLADPARNFERNRRAGWSDVNLLDRIPEVDGFFSLVPRQAWQVTDLPYSQPHRDFSPLLDFMGVTQLSQAENVCAWTSRSTALPLVTIGQQPLFLDDRSCLEALTQTNLDLGRTVFLPPEARAGISARALPTARVQSLEFRNQNLAFETESATSVMAVIAQTYYPAWKAYVDGRPTKIWHANYAFQALQIPAGKHRVDLVYKDRMLLAGIVLSGLGLAGLVTFGLLAHSEPRTTTG